MASPGGGVGESAGDRNIYNLLRLIARAIARNVKSDTDGMARTGDWRGIRCVDTSTEQRIRFMPVYERDIHATQGVYLAGNSTVGVFSDWGERPCCTHAKSLVPLLL